MGKIYSNNLHFLWHLLKCPVGNAENGISEPLNLKMFLGSIPQDPLLWSAFGLLTFFPLRTPYKYQATPLKSIQVSKTCFSQQLHEAISQVNHYQPGTFMVQI